MNNKFDDSKFAVPLRKRILNKFAYGKQMTTHDLIEFTIKETEDEIREQIKNFKSWEQYFDEMGTKKGKEIFLKTIENILKDIGDKK